MRPEDPRITHFLNPDPETKKSILGLQSLADATIFILDTVSKPHP